MSLKTVGIVAMLSLGLVALQVYARQGAAGPAFPPQASAQSGEPPLATQSEFDVDPDLTGEIGQQDYLRLYQAELARE